MKRPLVHRRRPCRLPTRDGNASFMFTTVFLLFLLLLLTSPTDAVRLKFNNCLQSSILHSQPQALQFVPLDVDVAFDTNNHSYPLNVTVYGNVTGTADRRSSYPSPDSPGWSDPKNTVGKIVDLSLPNNRYSTLFNSIDMLSFTAYNHRYRLCNQVTHGSCPLGPVFYTERFIFPLPVYLQMMCVNEMIQKRYGRLACYLDSEPDAD